MTARTRTTDTNAHKQGQDLLYNNKTIDIQSIPEVDDLHSVSSYVSRAKSRDHGGAQRHRPNRTINVDDASSNIKVDEYLQQEFMFSPDHGGKR